MSRLLLVLLCAFVATSTALINCCSNQQACKNACNQQGCGITLCCGNGCTVGGQQVPACGCACGGCPNLALAKSGLLGKALADTVLLNDDSFKVIH